MVLIILFRRNSQVDKGHRTLIESWHFLGLFLQNIRETTFVVSGVITEVCNKSIKLICDLQRLRE